jgi:hypothetical protein
VLGVGARISSERDCVVVPKVAAGWAPRYGDGGSAAGIMWLVTVVSLVSALERSWT